MLDAIDNFRNDDTKVLSGMQPETIRGALDRILKSRVFVHSHRIRRFLQFVVEESLAGQQQRLKEYLIGLEVFNRVEAFDPRVDSIVRVEARRLRAKLEEYYQTEGRDDDVRIELRKGSYIPFFETRKPGFGGFGHIPSPSRKSSLFINSFSHDEDHNLEPMVRQRLTHAILSEGCCQVVATNATNGGNGTVAKPDYILDGRIEKSSTGANDYKVCLQVMNVADGTYFWAESRSANELDLLAKSLNRALVTAYLPFENGHLERHRSRNQSFDFYLQGRYMWKRGSPDAVRNSSTLFAKAVEKDPAYAAAWVALSKSLIVSSLFGFQNPAETGPKIMEAAERAAELNPTLAGAHVALGAARSIFEWNWQEGEREFQKAIQLDSYSTSVHDAYALQLASRGMLGPAMLEAERALELDPACLSTNFILGWLRGVQKKYDQAISQHSLVSQLAPDFPLAYLGLGWAHAGKGLYRDAIAYFTNASHLLKSRALLGGCLGYCYGKMGQREEAMRQLAVLSSQPANQYTSPVSLAAIHSGLDEADRAFQYLEQAADLHDASLPLLLLNPEFESLRNTRRYADLLRRIGLLAV